MKEPKVLNSVTNILIEELVKVDIGDKIPPYTKLEEIANCGSGTIKKALEELEYLGCFEFDRSNSRTTLVAEDISKCSHYHSFEKVNLSLPKETNFRIENLLAACKEAISGVAVTHSSNSLNIIDDLISGKVQLGIVSKRTYMIYQNHLSLINDFGAYSYAKYSIVKLHDTPDIEELKIGKNQNDFDLSIATDNTFTGSGFEFVDVRNSQIRKKLQDNEIQMAIVDTDDFDCFQFEVVDFDYDINATHACLVCMNYNEELIKSTINKELLISTFLQNK